MAVIDKLRSFFRGTKAKAKTEEPKPTSEAVKKEAPQAPQKGS